MRTQHTPRKQMSDPTGTPSCHLSWWFPLFLQLYLSHIFHSYTCGSTCCSSAQPGPERQPTYLPFLCHPQAKKTAHSHSESGGDYQRREQSSLITEVTKMLEHMDHMPRWRLTAHRQWHQTQEAPSHPAMSSQTLWCALCDWTWPWAAPTAVQGQCLKSSDRAPFPTEIQWCWLTQSSWAALPRGS